MKVERILAIVFSLACCCSVFGCNSIIRNDTPEKIPQNSSEIYTMAMTVVPNGRDIAIDENSARIVIDGEVHNMNKSGTWEYTYDYKRPPKKHRASYYYEVDYVEKSRRNERSKLDRSCLYDLTIANRYVIGFESGRGIPGSLCTLIGRGFEDGDYIEIGNIKCQTTFISPNSLSFTVPMMETRGKYHARLVSDNGDIGLGVFTVDPMMLYASLPKIELSSGEKQALSVSIDFDAPEGGILIDVTTNVPESIVMDDILIPAGANSAVVMVQGATSGSAMLYLTANGFDELKIPVKVVPSSAYYDNLSFEDNDEPVNGEFLTL
ncbi:MAG: IPT/TIG domain-containing protein [Puniceicoccales bacterium]|nr:IPT/TIG domain-containing protein [Puniceicoccales bacterium]